VGSSWRQAEVALERGRSLLDSVPYPQNLVHHCVVDPTRALYETLSRRVAGPLSNFVYKRASTTTGQG
jgi:hypothetical protein